MNNPPVDAAGQGPSGKSAGTGAVVFMVLFSLPFAGFGVFALFESIKKFVAGDARNGMGLGLFGLVFSTVGFGLMFAMIWGRRKMRQTDELQARFADKPWLARPDWAAGKIKSKYAAPVGLYLLWSLLALAVSAPVVWRFPHEWQTGNHAILVALIFPVVAFYLLGYSFVLWRSRRRFGECYFELAQIPAPLGCTLEGMIQTGARVRLEHGLHLKLACIRRQVSGSGEQRTVREIILWQDEKVFKTETILPEPEPGHSGIPVFFKLPADQPESQGQGNESTFWRLTASARMSGPNFLAAFEVPVFNVAGAVTAEAAEEPDPTAAMQMPIEDLRRDENSKIRITDGPGGREFYFPAARNLGTAILLTIIFLALAGAFYEMVVHHFFLIFEVFLGFFTVIIGLFCFNQCFQTSRVTVNPGGVTVRKGYLFFSRTRQVSAGEIIGFQTGIGMTSGNTAFNDLKLVVRGNDDSLSARKALLTQPGNPVRPKFRIYSPGGITIASSLASKPEADWLVREMNRALGRCT